MTSLSGRMATFPAKGPKWIPQVRYAVTTGHGARRSVPHQAPARRVHGTPPLPPPQFSSSDGIWHRQIEPRPTWCRASRHDISCDKRRPRLSPQLQPDMAQGTIMTDGIYNYQYDCPYTEAMADVGKKLSTLFSIGEKSGQLRPYVRPVDANFVAGHHGCSLTCQAPIC